MFKNLTYKKKSKLLGIAIVVFFVISYFAAIHNTVNIFIENNVLRLKVDTLSKTFNNVDEYKKKLLAIDNIINQKDSSDIQQKVLNVVSNYCNKNNIILKDFPQPLIYSEKGYEISTNIFEVEGSFIKLLKLIYELEQVNVVGKVMSVHYETKKNFKTKSYALTATIYLLNIKKIKKNENAKK